MLTTDSDTALLFKSKDETQERGGKREHAEPEKQGTRPPKNAELTQTKADLISKDSGPPVSSEAHSQVPPYPTYPPPSSAPQGPYPPYYDPYVPYMYPPPPPSLYQGYPPPNVMQQQQQQQRQSGTRGMKRSDKDEGHGQGRWDSHRLDQSEPKRTDERPRILAKHEKKKEPEAAAAEGIEAKDAKESGGGSKRTSLSEAEESSHHVTFAEATSEESNPALTTGDGSGQVPEAQQRNQPRKIMMRYNTEPTAEEGSTPGKADHTVVQKVPIKDKPKQVQVQDSQLKEEDALDDAPDSPEKAAVGWNVHGRGPIKSKTLYEPEGRESEEKFKKYLHTAEGKFHKAEKDTKPVPSESRQLGKEGEGKDVQTAAGTTATASVVTPVTEGKVPPPLNNPETIEHKDTPVETPEPQRVPSEGPVANKFPQKTGDRQWNGGDRQRGDSHVTQRRDGSEYPARGRGKGGRGKDWQDRPTRGRDRQEHLPRDDQDRRDPSTREYERRDHLPRDQEHLAGEQGRQGPPFKDQDRRDHPARNYTVKDQDRKDHQARGDHERQDHPYRDRNRQDFPSKGKDRQECLKEAQDQPAKEHDKQDHPKYQDRRDQQDDLPAREQDRQSKRKGPDQPRSPRDKEWQAVPPSPKENAPELRDHPARDQGKKGNLALREPDVQQQQQQEYHHPRQKEVHYTRERDARQQEYYSGPRQRVDKRSPRVQEGRDQDERRKGQGQLQEKVDTSLTQPTVTEVEQQKVPAAADATALEGGEKITTKQPHAAAPSPNVQAQEHKRGAIEDGSQRRGSDSQRRFESQQWNSWERNSRQQGQARSGGGSRQRGDHQRSAYGDRRQDRQKGSWEREQTDHQSTPEVVDTPQQPPSVAPAKDMQPEPKTPTESSAPPQHKVSTEGVSQSQLPSSPRLAPAAKHERTHQRTHRDNWGGRQGQRGPRYDHKDRQPHRDEGAGEQQSIQKGRESSATFSVGKDSAAFSGGKESSAGERAHETKVPTSGGATEPEKRLDGIDDQKPTRGAGGKDSSFRSNPKGGSGRRGRSAGYEEVQQQRLASSEVEGNVRSKSSPGADLGYAQLEDINSDSDYSDYEEEPVASLDPKTQQDQAKAPQGSRGGYRSDQGQYGSQRSFRGSRRHFGDQRTSRGPGRGRGRTRNEGDRRDRRGGAEVVGGTGAKEQTQLAAEGGAAVDADTAAKSVGTKDVKSKKEISAGPKSDLSVYDLHSHKVAIVDDNMKEEEDDRDSGNSGAFVEVTSKRTHKEKQKKEREEQQKKEEVGKHRDEDKHRKGHRSRPVDSSAHVQAPRAAWTSTGNKADLGESSTSVAWGTTDPSNVPPSTSSNSSGSWITNALPSNAAPGAELKMANQRTDTAPSSTTVSVARIAEPPSSTSYVSKEGSTGGNSAAGGGSGGFTPFSSPFALNLLSAAVDQSMSSGHDVLPTTSSEKPLATAKVFAAGTQDEPKGPADIIRGGAVGHGKEGGHRKDAPPPRLQSSGRGAGRGHSARKDNAKVRNKNQVFLFYDFSPPPISPC